MNLEDLSVSIVIPAYNEVAIVGTVVSDLRAAYPTAEILVVDDGSTDGTGAAAQAAGATVARHQYNMGNGAAVKTGARKATGAILVFMDADGQHNYEDVETLISKINEGYELVVGARGEEDQATKGRKLGNKFLNRFASVMTGYKIVDLTSGFRAVNRHVFREFLYLLPNSYSYPTTSTMAYIRSAYPVAYIPISVRSRVGVSKLNFVRDGVRFLVIVMKVTTLFSPMRFFLPASLLFFLLGLGRYLYFYFQTGSFSNMAGVLFVTSALVFLIGLVSEQITAFHYGMSKANDNRK